MNDEGGARQGAGGFRQGAGRKTEFGEPTKPVRIPISQISSVRDYLKHRLDPKRVVAEVVSAAEIAPSHVPLPQFLSKVSAGFPSPADDYVEARLDLNDHLVRHREATFFVRVKGDSMVNAGIHDGDLLVVDKAVPATHGKVVVAEMRGELTVKTLCIKDGRAYLLPANPNYPAIPVCPEEGVTIWGVVTNSIHSL